MNTYIRCEQSQMPTINYDAIRAIPDVNGCTVESDDCQQWSIVTGSASKKYKIHVNFNGTMCVCCMRLDAPTLHYGRLLIENRNFRFTEAEEKEITKEAHRLNEKVLLVNKDQNGTFKFYAEDGEYLFSMDVADQNNIITF